MSKFKDFLTETGDSLINKRADALTSATKDAFEDEKRMIERKIRNIENEIVSSLDKMYLEAKRDEKEISVLKRKAISLFEHKIFD